MDELTRTSIHPIPSHPRLGSTNAFVDMADKKKDTHIHTHTRVHADLSQRPARYDLHKKIDLSQTTCSGHGCMLICFSPDLLFIKLYTKLLHSDARESTKNGQVKRVVFPVLQFLELSPLSTKGLCRLFSVRVDDLGYVIVGFVLLLGDCSLFFTWLRPSSRHWPQRNAVQHAQSASGTCQRTSECNPPAYEIES